MGSWPAEQRLLVRELCWGCIVNRMLFSAVHYARVHELLPSQAGEFVHVATQGEQRLDRLGSIGWADEEAACYGVS